jgi:hypothetical protein
MALRLALLVGLLTMGGCDWGESGTAGDGGLAAPECVPPEAPCSSPEVTVGGFWTRDECPDGPVRHQVYTRTADGVLLGWAGPGQAEGRDCWPGGAVGHYHDGTADVDLCWDRAGAETDCAGIARAIYDAQHQLDAGAP